MATDFIGIYEGYVPDDLCEVTIEALEKVAMSVPSELNQGEFENPNGRISRHDEAISLHTVDYNLCSGINVCLSAALEEYSTQFSILKPVHFRSMITKVQKTEVGGGYMDWHFESSAPLMSHRIMTWVVYLNDLPEGEGETEFLYQHKRLRPKKGTVVIFPAAYTHTHRGNPPLTTTKYIATGWYELY